MAEPLIGITTGEIYNLNVSEPLVTYGQTYTYSDSVDLAGGVPMLIPLTGNDEALQKRFDKLDGLLMAGGNDVDAVLYGQQPYENHETYSEKRDQAEIKLVKMALERGMPVLAICRGMQLLNIVLGGDLYQHIPDDLPEASDHQVSAKAKKDEYGQHVAHTLRVDPDSKLSDIIGARQIGANTYHHQAIKTLASDLVATAWSEDGIIEAVEMPKHPFCIGVQSHIESLAPGTEPLWLNLFKAFTQASANFKQAL